MARAKYMKWTEDLIKEKIYEAIEILKIDRMPTKNELCSIRMSGLAKKIVETRGFVGWANDLGFKPNKENLTLEKVRVRFSEKGLILLADEYENNRTKMEFICPKHPDKKQSIGYNQLVSMDGGCKYCSWEKLSENRKTPFDEVLEKFNSFGIDLLEINYEGSGIPMKCRCRKHTEYIQEKTYSSLNANEGCKYCGRETTSMKLRKDFDDVVKAFKRMGLELLEINYINQSEKMKYRCKIHNEFIQEINFANLSMGHGCYICGREITSEKLKRDKNKNWKGGVSPLNIVLRECLGDWKKSILEHYDYKCCISGEKNDLQIHHAKQFYQIRDEVLKELGFNAFFKREKWSVSDFTNEQLETIKQRILEKHTLNIGFPITKYKCQDKNAHF